jgi:hypothetical protein
MTLSEARSHVSDDVMVRLDGWHRPFTGPAGDGAYKEWMHFCVALQGGGHLLVNLNVTEHGDRRTPRLVVLAWDGCWSGKVETFDDDEVAGRPGRLNVRLGRNALEWRDRAFHLSLSLGDIAAELCLRPDTPPTVTTSVALGADSTLHWVVVPRLSATGWLRLGSRAQIIQDRLAYHDHNWGDFRWGGELSWEWGFVHSTRSGHAWDLVLARVSDGAGHRTISQSALLWRAGRLVRVFQNRELALTLEGAAPRARPFTVPPVASLLAPGTSSGVPERFLIRARGMHDVLDVTYRVAESARVALPSEADPLKLVLLNETCGRACVRGTVASKPLEFEGAAMMEFVRG